MDFMLELTDGTQAEKVGRRIGSCFRRSARLPARAVFQIGPKRNIRKIYVSLSSLGVDCG
jgi:hypothetical protein